MKRFLFLALFLVGSLNSKAQINFTINTGTDALIGLQAGYRFPGKLEAGVKYIPSLQIISEIGSAGYIAPFGKYWLSDVSANSKRKSSFYVTGTLGLITPPKNNSATVVTDVAKGVALPIFASLPDKFMGTALAGVSTKEVSYDSTIGASIGFGTEYGKSKLRLIGEFGAGKVPNSLKSIDSIQADSSIKDLTQIFYINTGLKYIF